jgi:crotonobetainyl-CoA:carnitine CoA-transferase CaiB-like acyl-CoA transferase
MKQLASGNDPGRRGNRSLHAAPHDCYRTGEDRWCVIVVATDAQWIRFCELAGHPEWAHDPRFVDLDGRLCNAAELDRIVEGWTATRTDYDVMHLLQGTGTAAGVVQTVEDQARRDRQLAAPRCCEVAMS